MNINRHRRSRGRYAKPTHRIRNTFVGIVVTFVALGTIGACSEDTPAESDGRTVTVIEDGYDADDAGRKVMTQEDFPCNEDEVLTYDPSFGLDHVGCINHEDVK